MLAGGLPLFERVRHVIECARKLTQLASTVEQASARAEVTCLKALGRIHERVDAAQNKMPAENQSQQQRKGRHAD